MVFRPIKLIRNFGNKLGLAWWAKIETEQPNTTYWYGPFITKRSLKENILSSKLRLLRNGPYQYVALGFSVSILAHQANPSLFPKFLINFFGLLNH